MQDKEPSEEELKAKKYELNSLNYKYSQEEAEELANNPERNTYHPRKKVERNPLSAQVRALKEKYHKDYPDDRIQEG